MTLFSPPFLKGETGGLYYYDEKEVRGKTYNCEKEEFGEGGLEKCNLP